MRNAWHRGTLGAFDIESSGTSVDGDRIVTATLATIQGRDVQAASWLIDCPIDIPQGATDVHGITTAVSREHGMPAADAVKEIAAAMTAAEHAGTPVIAYNAPFDFTMLDRECRRYGATLTLPFVVDPFVIDKELDKYRRGKRTLTATCEHYRVRLDAAHDATQDALAAARLAWRLAETYPDQLQVGLPHLHANQQAWRADWAAQFQTYLRKKGEPDAVVNGAWPVIPLPAGWDPTAVPTTGNEAAA